MKVLHVPYTYYPDACGGTEVYVAALCRFLGEAGVENEVAAPAAAEATYDHAGLRVRRFATHPGLTQQMMYGEGDPLAAAGFARVLEASAPDLVHFHAFTPAVSVLCLREAQERNIPAITTYHTPTNSCLRGTLMRWGTIPCDGEILPHRCAACLLHAHGMPRPLASLAALASRLTSPLATLPGLSNAMRALLGSTALVEQRRLATREWWAGMRQVVALCDWTRRLLLINGVPSHRISLSRHGLPSPAPVAAVPPPPSEASPLKLVFFGRADPTKGIDLLIHALRLAPELRVTLDFYLIGGDGSAAEALIAQANADSRIAIRRPVPASQVESTLRSYHALLVPSRWLETGPLVVLEAFAAGVPVVGSDLGGIAERVTHEVDGLLVSKMTAEAWRDTLHLLATKPGLLCRLRAGVKPPRSMQDVSADMLHIYSQELNLTASSQRPKEVWAL